jgi:hypothetical protein
VHLTALAASFALIALVPVAPFEELALGVLDHARTARGDVLRIACGTGLRRCPSHRVSPVVRPVTPAPAVYPPAGTWIPEFLAAR